MLTAIIDYESGNLHSAQKAFEKMAQEMDAGQVVVTSDPDVVAGADRIVLPGDGAFPACQKALQSSAVYEALIEVVAAKGRPFLGICVGMQLMAREGREYEVTQGLGWIDGVVDRIAPKDASLKIPHMGWNTIDKVGDHPLWQGIPTGPDGLHAYFVHSYHLEPVDPSHILATCDYAQTLTAMVGRDNIAGTQFHPEKSQTLGLALISNFLTWRP